MYHDYIIPYLLFGQLTFLWYMASVIHDQPTEEVNMNGRFATCVLIWPVVLVVAVGLVIKDAISGRGTK